MDNLLKYSLLDGLFANMFATLTAGLFLTSLAIYLGLSDLLIGLLGAMPFIVTAFQLPTSMLLERFGGRKKLAVMASLSARLIWIPILLTALVSVKVYPYKTVTVLLLIFCSHVCISISYIAWFSWISDLVPEYIRGSFFGRRNMFCGLGGLLVMIAFGRLLDFSETLGPSGMAFGFIATFGMAILCGLISSLYLLRLPNHFETTSINHPPLRLREPFGDANFRKFLYFSFLWNFGVYFAAPFFTLYSLRDLHFSHNFVAIMGGTSALANLFLVTFWGRISDRVKNRPVILLAGVMVSLLPLGWLMVGPSSRWVVIVIHLVGGSFWAGITLCFSNLLIHIAPRENASVFYSMTSLVTGVAAALAPVISGLLAHRLAMTNLPSLGIKPLHVVFFISFLLRFSSLFILARVHEPQEGTVKQLIRIVRSVRGLNLVMGFAGLLHPFQPIRERKPTSQEEEIVSGEK